MVEIHGSNRTFLQRMSTDEPIPERKKIDFGTATEDDVQRFVEHAFSTDFVFRSPHHEKGGKQKETTDVLAVFGDVAMPIQVKSQAYNADGSPRSPDPSWTKKNLEKAAAQVKGAVRMLKSGKSILKNSRRGEMRFTAEHSPYLYGLVVLNHVSAPFNAVELVPALRDLDFPVHVLSFVDFFNLNRILDTPHDLINYFEMRADVLIPSLNPRVHDEQTVFHYYLDNLEELMELRAKSHGDPMTAADAAPYAEALRKIYRRELPDLQASYFIDRIIARAHEVDEALDSPFEDGSQADRGDYSVIAVELGEIVRPRRVSLGREFLSAIERAGKENRVAFAHASSKKRDDCILFVASPRPREERTERSQELRDLLFLLKATRQVRRAFGIVTEAGFDNGRSYDFIVLDSDPRDVMKSPDYEAIKRMGEGLFGAVTSPVAV